MLDKTTGYDGELHAVIDGVHAKTDAIGMGTRMAQTISGHPYVMFTCKVAEDGDVSMAIFEMQEKLNAHIYRVRDKAGASDGALFAYWRKLPTIEVNNKGKMIVKARFLASYEVDDGSYSDARKLKFNHETYTLDPLEVEPDVVEAMPTKEEIAAMRADDSEPSDALEAEPLAEVEVLGNKPEPNGILLIGLKPTVADVIKFVHAQVDQVGFGTKTALTYFGQDYKTIAFGGDTPEEALCGLAEMLSAYIKATRKKVQNGLAAFWRILPVVKGERDEYEVLKYKARCRVTFADTSMLDARKHTGHSGSLMRFNDERDSDEPMAMVLADEPVAGDAISDIPKLDIPKMMGAIESELKPWGLTAHSQVMPQPLTIGQAIDGITDILKRIEGDDPDDQNMVLGIVGDIWRRRARRAKS